MANSTVFNPFTKRLDYTGAGSTGAALQAVIPFDLIDSTRYPTITVSTGNTFTNSAAGEVITRGTGATAEAQKNLNPQNYSTKFYDFNPKFAVTAKLDVGAGACTNYLCFDDFRNGTYFGFKQVSTGLAGAAQYYAVSAVGSVETATAITLTNAHWYSFAAVMTSASKVEYYVDGTLVATITTNLPSGVLNNYLFSAGSKGDGVTASGGGQLTVYNGSVMYDIPVTTTTTPSTWLSLGFSLMP